MPLFASANLVVNGSFETGNFIDNTGQDTDNLSVGSTAMTGWTVTTAALAWIGPSNPFGLSADNGNYFLDLTGYHDDEPYAGVAQTSIPTVSGQQYDVSFALGYSSLYNTAPVGMQVSVTGASTQNFTFGGAAPTAANQWQVFNFIFTANAASTQIAFTGTGPDFQKYIGLDNVIVNAVPEPSTVLAGALLLIPFGASTLRILRRRPDNQSSMAQK